MIVNIKEHPRLERVIKTGMPANRKRSAIIITADSTHISSYWSGGSIDKWSGVRQGKQIDLPPHAGAPGFERPGNYGGEHVHLDDGLALVCGGTSCGKPATPKVYANESTMKELLT
jgi:hypothetical protein